MSDNLDLDALEKLAEHFDGAYLREFDEHDAKLLAEVLTAFPRLVRYAKIIRDASFNGIFDASDVEL